MGTQDYRQDSFSEDIEKRAHHSHEESEDDDSFDSSEISVHSGTRILSAQYRSNEPILAQYNASQRERTTPTTVRIPLFRQTVCVCTPRKFTRYFALILILTVAGFFFTLAKLSLNSSRIVDLGRHKSQAAPPIWLQFEFLQRYHGGVRTLVATKENVPEYPEPASSSKIDEVGQELAHDEERPALPASTAVVPSASDDIVKCYLDDAKTIAIPDVRAFPGVPRGMPESIMGSHKVIGLKDEVCYDRFGRLGPYGLGYSQAKGGSGAGMNGDREGIQDIWQEYGQVDYRNILWKAAQDKCLEANQRRYGVSSPKPTTGWDQSLFKKDESSQTSNIAKAVPRKAIVLRTWTGFQYDDEDLFYLRALMWELSLQTGAEYTLHFLIHVQDDELPIWGDENVYQQTLKDSLPPEFAGMGTLWSEGQMQLIYNMLPYNEFRDLPLHGVYRSHHMALTWFSYQHPEFDQIWQLEMDMRYTGHYRELISKAEQWAAKQPRKGLWERNARFYVPSEHGTWEDFSHMVRVQTEHGTATRSNMFANLANNPGVPDAVKNQVLPKPELAIWGPNPPLGNPHDNLTDVFPPHSVNQDKSEWGVGEEADLIVFNPLFDPDGTDWVLSEDVTGYDRSNGFPPRRAAITTFGKYSRRLLSTMHRDMATHGRHMSSEMFAATTALHHGYKAVYVPHPVYVDRKWPTDLLAATFNGGRNGRAGGSRLSVFSEAREHNFRGLSWYYNSGFAPNLWHRWFGYRVDNDGGESQEVAGEGRMCLPAMLLHPVKQVDLIYQEDGAEEDGM